jgi:hypothetical protein
MSSYNESAMSKSTKQMILNLPAIEHPINRLRGIQGDTEEFKMGNPYKIENYP